jgi:hypothetical protein
LVVTTDDGVVVSNPTYGGRLWYSPIREFAPPVEGDSAED